MYILEGITRDGDLISYRFDRIKGFSLAESAEYVADLLQLEGIYSYIVTD